MAGLEDIVPKLMKIALTNVDFAILSLKTRTICGPPVGISMGSGIQFENYVKRIMAMFHVINLLCGQSRN